MATGVQRHPILSNFLAYKDYLYDILSKRWVLASITVIPVIGLYLFITILPIVWAIFSSFHDIPLIAPEWEWVGLANYQYELQSAEFWASLRRSVVFAGGSVALQVTVGTAIALVINQDFIFDKVIRAIVMLPYLIPTAVVGFLATWMGNSQWGIINWIFINSGLIREPIAFFGSGNIAMASLIVLNSWKFAIFVTIIVLARLQSIDDGFYEAAEMAGANTLQKFRDVTFPQIKGVLILVTLLRGIFMFNKFDIIWIVTQGGPLDATTTAPVYGYKVAFESLKLGRANAVSTLLFLVLAAGAVVYFLMLDPEEEARVE